MMHDFYAENGLGNRLPNYIFSIVKSFVNARAFITIFSENNFASWSNAEYFIFC